MEPNKNEQFNTPISTSGHETKGSLQEQEAFFAKEIAAFQATPSLVDEMTLVAKDLGIELGSSTRERLQKADEEVQKDFAFLMARAKEEGFSIAA
jgi:hypothetical protein